MTAHAEDMVLVPRAELDCGRARPSSVESMTSAASSGAMPQLASSCRGWRRMMAASSDWPPIRSARLRRGHDRRSAASRAPVALTKPLTRQLFTRVP